LPKFRRESSQITWIPGSSAILRCRIHCYDLYVSEEQVARIAKELTGSASAISNLNRGSKHQIDTSKIRSLGMTFGGEALLRQTVQELIEAHRRC
jgi:hypothetical protein